MVSRGLAYGRGSARGTSFAPLSAVLSKSAHRRASLAGCLIGVRCTELPDLYWTKGQL
jgi:hypothetical protein